VVSSPSVARLTGSGGALAQAPHRQSSRQNSRSAPASDSFTGESLQNVAVLTVNPPEGAPIVPPQSNANGRSDLQQEPDESRDFAIAMASIAHDTKGSDIMVLHVAPLIYWTSYMVRLMSDTSACIPGSQMARPDAGKRVWSMSSVTFHSCRPGHMFVSAGLCHSLFAATVGCCAGQDGEGGR
jgi:hypothetical protein